MRPCRRARVCPERASTTFPFQVLLHSTTFPSVEGARQHSICDAQCEMYIGLAPQDNIRIGRAVDTAEAGWSTSTCFYFSLCVPPPLWGGRAHPSTPIVDSKLDSRCQNCSSRAPCGAWGAGGRDLDKIFEIGKGFVGLLERDWWNCSTTKCFKRGKR